MRCGASPSQKGMLGGAPWASSTRTRAGGFDALDAPAGVAEEDDVAGGGVDGEVLVEGGDLYAFRLQDDGEERGVGDGAAV